MECLAQLTSLLSVAADIATAVMAFIAVVISIRALSHQQRHDKITLRPQLTFRFERVAGHNEYHVLRWLVENNGMGPAVVRHFAVVANDHKQAFPPVSYSLGLFPQNLKALRKEEVFKKDEVIPAGRSVELFSINLQDGAAVPQVLNTLYWEFKYASFFEEEWDFSTDRVQLPMKMDWDQWGN